MYGLLQYNEIFVLFYCSCFTVYCSIIPFNSTGSTAYPAQQAFNSLSSVCGRARANELRPRCPLVTLLAAYKTAVGVVVLPAYA